MSGFTWTISAIPGSADQFPQLAFNPVGLYVQNHSNLNLFIGDGTVASSNNFSFVVPPYTQGGFFVGSRSQTFLFDPAGVPGNTGNERATFYVTDSFISPGISPLGNRPQRTRFGSPINSDGSHATFVIPDAAGSVSLIQGGNYEVVSVTMYAVEGTAGGGVLQPFVATFFQQPANNYFIASGNTINSPGVPIFLPPGTVQFQSPVTTTAGAPGASGLAMSIFFPLGSPAANAVQMGWMANIREAFYS